MVVFLENVVKIIENFWKQPLLSKSILFYKNTEAISDQKIGVDETIGSVFLPEKCVTSVMCKNYW